MTYWLMVQMNKKLIKFGFASLIALCLFTFASSTWIVQTQNLTEVRLHPEWSVATEGDLVFVTMDVTQGENLSGYDLTITYDASVVSLASWAHGSYLSNPAVVYKDIQPGIIRLAAVQVAQAGVSGDGTLLILTFKAEHFGESVVVIESVELATANGTLVIPTTSDGVIRVNTPATATPTPTKTPTHTSTPTITLIRTSTRTATSTFTRTPGSYDTATLTSMITVNPTEFTTTPTRGQVERTKTLQTGMKETEFYGTLSFTAALSSANNTKTPPDQTQMTPVITQGVSSTTHSTDSSIYQLNRLLWGFAILLLAALAIMVIILIRHGNHQNTKG